MLENNLSQQNSQLQLQQLNAVQLQGLAMLAKPLPELVEALKTEQENNPLLEVIVPSCEELAGEPLSDAAMAGNEMNIDEFDGEREDFPLLDKLADSWQESDWADYSGSAEDGANAQQRHDYQFAQLTTPRSLSDILYEQLDFCDLTRRQRRAAEQIFGCLDERGFLTTPAADIAMSFDLTLDEAVEAIKLVQSFDPPGVAARDTAECWMIQLKRRNHSDERIYQLLTEYRDDLEHNRLPRIAKALDVSVEDIYDMLNVLKNLNSVPTAGLDTSSAANVVTPEFAVELKNGQLHIEGRESSMPKLGIAGHYLKMLDDPGISPDTREYLREKLSQAENLIKNVDLRQSTIRRITEVIVEKQSDFFRNGAEFLQPMTMEEVAAKLDLHETTISRAVAGKYLDTPQGLKEYRYFFSGGYTDAGGNDVSSRSVKEIIRKIIADEDPRKPISDAAISEKLAAQGLQVARRTVAKYRESMNIAPTNLRKIH